MKEERIASCVDKRVYTANTGGLFTLYIPNSQSLTSRSDLDLLTRYRIFPSLNLDYIIVIVSYILSNNMEFLVTNSML